MKTPSSSGRYSTSTGKRRTPDTGAFQAATVRRHPDRCGIGHHGCQYQLQNGEVAHPAGSVPFNARGDEKRNRFLAGMVLKFDFGSMSVSNRTRSRTNTSPPAKNPKPSGFFGIAPVQLLPAQENAAFFRWRNFPGYERRKQERKQVPPDRRDRLRHLESGSVVFVLPFRA